MSLRALSLQPFLPQLPPRKGNVPVQPWVSRRWRSAGLLWWVNLGCAGERCQLCGGGQGVSLINRTYEGVQWTLNAEQVGGASHAMLAQEPASSRNSGEPESYKKIHPLGFLQDFWKKYTCPSKVFNIEHKHCSVVSRNPPPQIWNTAQDWKPVQQYPHLHRWRKSMGRSLWGCSLESRSCAHGEHIPRLSSNVSQYLPRWGGTSPQSVAPFSSKEHLKIWFLAQKNPLTDLCILITWHSRVILHFEKLGLFFFSSKCSLPNTLCKQTLMPILYSTCKPFGRWTATQT